MCDVSKNPFGAESSAIIWSLALVHLATSVEIKRFLLSRLPCSSVSCLCFSVAGLSARCWLGAVSHRDLITQPLPSCITLLQWVVRSRYGTQEMLAHETPNPSLRYAGLDRCLRAGGEFWVAKSLGKTKRNQSSDIKEC